MQASQHDYSHKQLLKWMADRKGRKDIESTAGLWPHSPALTAFVHSPLVSHAPQDQILDKAMAGSLNSTMMVWFTRRLGAWALGKVRRFTASRSVGLRGGE